MRKRIAITALSALFAAGSLFGVLARPALADPDHHHQRGYHHHHAYQNPGRHLGWNNGQHARYTGYGSGNQSGTWVNGKYYPNGYTADPNRWNGGPNRWAGDGDHDRDDRKPHHHHHHKDHDDRR